MEGYLAAGGVAAIFYLLFRFLRFMADREHSDGHWHCTGSKMRRRVKGAWQYREMTKADREEQLELQDRNAW